VRFVWSRDARALSYRLEIRGPAGELLHSATAPDTTILVDLSTPDLAGQETTWRVIPRDSTGDGSPSPAVSLRVVSP
jgi:hypothetical protein